MSDYRCRVCGDYFCSCIKHRRTPQEERLFKAPYAILREANRLFEEWATKPRRTRLPAKVLEQYRDRYQKAMKAYREYVNPSCPCEACVTKREALIP